MAADTRGCYWHGAIHEALLLLGLLQVTIGIEHSSHEALRADGQVVADSLDEVLPFSTDAVGHAASTPELTAAPTTSTAASCDLEFFVCANGQKVRRMPPTCDFAECPVGNANAALMQARAVGSAGDIQKQDPVEPCEPDILECEDGTRVIRHLPSCAFAPCPSVSPTQEIPPPQRHCHHCQHLATNTTASDATDTGSSAVEPVAASQSPITVTVTVTMTPDPWWGLPHDGYKGLVGTFPPLDLVTTTLPVVEGPSSASTEVPAEEPTDADVLGPGITSYDKAVVDEGSTIVRKEADMPGVQEAVQAGAPAKDRYIHRFVYGGILALLLLGCGIFFVRSKKKKKDRQSKKEEEQALAQEQANTEVVEETCGEDGEYAAEVPPESSTQAGFPMA
mmetsp:Transcript_28714/g.52310  ORF Transcript_28714/g.52310 Transcript_28714/m.52310 type:complete len:393 (-) Transcript_28714:66-1244(-)